MTEKPCNVLRTLDRAMHCRCVVQSIGGVRGRENEAYDLKMIQYCAAQTEFDFGENDRTELSGIH